MSAEFYAMVEAEGVPRANDQLSEDGSNDSTINEDESSGNPLQNGQKKVALYQKWVSHFANDGIVLQDDQLICTICCKYITADKKSRLNEHVGSKKHQKILRMPEDQRPTSMTPMKKQKTSHGSVTKSQPKIDPEFVGRNGRDKTHEVLLADTLNLFVQLDVSFDKLNSEVWQNYVKKHVKNGEMIMKQFTFYQTSS